MPQRPLVRAKQKRRATKRLEAWREQQSKQAQKAAPKAKTATKSKA